jgi:hypothetical protein
VYVSAASIRRPRLTVLVPKCDPNITQSVRREPQFSQRKRSFTTGVLPLP